MVKQKKDSSGQLLRDSDAAFAAGDRRKGAYLVWEATLAALAPLAEIQGFPCNNREEALAFIRHLDGIDENGRVQEHLGYPSYPANYAAFLVNSCFLEQAEGIHQEQSEFQWGDEEFEIHRKTAKGYIARLEKQLWSEDTA